MVAVLVYDVGQDMIECTYHVTPKTAAVTPSNQILIVVPVFSFLGIANNGYPALVPDGLPAIIGYYCCTRTLVFHRCKWSQGAIRLAKPHAATRPWPHFRQVYLQYLILASFHHEGVPDLFLI